MTPSLFYASRRLYVLSRYYLGRIYDEDLLFVRNLGPTPLLVDVGANAGQSALTMALVCPRARIISFEANTHNLADLRAVKRILGSRYQFHHTALSDRVGCGWLKMPVAGKAPVPGESSLEERAFDDAALKERIGRFARIERQQVRLSTLDSHGLAADFIKIDVQGHELAVLRGSLETIRTRRPVLLMETNQTELRAIRDTLERESYRMLTYHPGSNRLRRCERPTTLNFFSLHDEHVQVFSSLVVGNAEAGGRPDLQPRATGPAADQDHARS